MPGLHARRFAGAIATASIALFACPACLQLSTGTGTDAGSTYSTTPSTGTASAATGTNCGQDPTGQVLLCEQIDVCPGLSVDPSVFPNCGFRLDGTSAIDIECDCSDSLCPVGAPQNCTQAAQLLSAQTGFAVCEQVAEGRCVSLAPPDAGTQSTCTSECQAECAGEPGCLTLCGC